MNKSSSLKEKTMTGLFWSFTDLVVNHGLQLLIQIVLARLLLPEHFGIVGMVLVFIAISNTVVDSGFSQALIRDQKTTQEDYSTVFYFNLLIAFIMYGLLYFLAPTFSNFFSEPQLIEIIRVLALVLIINSLGIIQKVILIKNVDFKTLTKIGVISAVTSGSLTITIALLGFGVWSLVINIISMQFIQTLLLCLFNRWFPTKTFNVQSFKKYFIFGYKLLLSGLIDAVYNNLFFVIIGKFYSVSQLGLYSNAVKLRDTASQAILVTVQRVSYPVLSIIQEDQKRLKAGFRKIMKTTAFISFPILTGLIATANPLFNLLLGDKWMPSVIYFQLLCLAGMVYPLNAINLNVLKVKGRSDLFLLIEIISKAIFSLLIILSLLLKLGIIGLIVAAILSTYINLFVNIYFSSKEIKYSIKEQLKDLFPTFVISIFMGTIVLLIGQLASNNYHLIMLIIQIGVGVFIYVAACKLFKVPELSSMYQIILGLFNKVQLILNENKEAKKIKARGVDGTE